MDKRSRKSESENFYEVLCGLADDKCRLDFDTFLIREMGFEFQSNQELELVRRPALREFRKRTGKASVASLPTIRKWFGIHGFTRPSREKVFEICFLLRTDLKKLEEYLMYGLGECSVIYQDYREMIFAYGIMNRKTFSFCKEMIRKFEMELARKKREPSEAGEKQGVAENLKKFLFDNQKEVPERFCHLLLENTFAFSGCNENAMLCIQKIKGEVMALVRKEAFERLEELLAETGFTRWEELQTKNDAECWKMVKNYIRNDKRRNHREISKNISTLILELCKIAFSEVDANSRLLIEVFSASGNQGNRSKRLPFSRIREVTGKHLSDLMNVSVQQERAKLIRCARLSIEEKDGDQICPVWICRLYRDYTRTEGKEPLSVGEARDWLTGFEKELRRRCICLNRSDILPMAHYVAQHRYLQNEVQDNREYDAEKGQREFEKIANHVLRQCNMAELSSEFEIDSVLLACYCQDEMYSYSDVLDIIDGD